MGVFNATLGSSEFLLREDGGGAPIDSPKVTPGIGKRSSFGGWEIMVFIGFLGFLVVFWWFLVKKPWLLTMVSNHGY